MVKRGTEVVGGMGLVLGLFAPPLLLATAIGAAIGADLGELVHSEVKSKIEQQAFETIPQKAVGEAEGKRVDALKKALAEAQEKMK